mmetsp:Transcript_48330/g.155789  ORF Transcript_48330/g.155789 Transcript_48330/m.155789 type:complete len:340 (-) Transcript_48330:725-1744(-)
MAATSRVKSSNLTPLALGSTMTVKIMSKVASGTVKLLYSPLPKARISFLSSMASLFLSYLEKMTFCFLTTSPALALAKNLTCAALRALMSLSTEALMAYAAFCRALKLGVPSSSLSLLWLPGTLLIALVWVLTNSTMAMTFSLARSPSASTLPQARLTDDSEVKSVFSDKTFTCSANFFETCSPASTSLASSSVSFLEVALASSRFLSISFNLSSFFFRSSFICSHFAVMAVRTFSNSACTTAAWEPSVGIAVVSVVTNSVFMASKVSGTTALYLFKPFRMADAAFASVCLFMCSSCFRPASCFLSATACCCLCCCCCCWLCWVYLCICCCWASTWACC